MIHMKSARQFDGRVVFELTGRNAAELALLLDLPLTPRSERAGVLVAIWPKELTSEEFDETVREEGGDAGGGSQELLELEFPNRARL